MTCRNCNQTADSTRHDILQCIAWSFEALGALFASSIHAFPL